MPARSELYVHFAFELPCNLFYMYMSSIPKKVLLKILFLTKAGQQTDSVTDGNTESDGEKKIFPTQNAVKCFEATSLQVCQPLRCQH